MARVKISVEPFGASRQRVTAKPTGKRDRKGNMIWRGSTYKHKGYAEWQKYVAPFFNMAAPASPMLGPLVLRLVVVGKFLEGDRRKTTHVPRRWHVARPDLDNVMKAVMDCAGDARWFLNDWQISRVVAEKCRAAQGEEPSLSVVIEPIETPYHLRG